MKELADYFSSLASAHKSVRHGIDGTHFASTLEEADNSYARVMRYPCVVYDEGDSFVSGTRLQTSVTVLFLQHVTDTANEPEKAEVFELARKIALDFIAQIHEMGDVPRAQYRFLANIDFDGATLLRIMLEDAALYGYALSFRFMEPLPDLCDSPFEFTNND